jgi:hypothetical protein
MDKQKTCFKCGCEKPITDYYKHKKMLDGHLNKCKACVKSDVKKRYDKLFQNSDFRESEKVRAREKYHRLYKGNVIIDSEKQKYRQFAYRNQYPEKYKAKNMSQHIKKSKGMHAHHWSYRESHAKDIIEITPKDHATIHRYMTYDQERMMYRNLSGILLDTKEKHMEYIEHVLNHYKD